MRKIEFADGRLFDNWNDALEVFNKESGLNITQPALAYRMKRGKAPFGNNNPRLAMGHLVQLGGKLYASKRQAMREMGINWLQLEKLIEAEKLKKTS